MSDPRLKALDGLIDVSRETCDKLDAYVALLARWQKAQNLVAPSTLQDVWSRHIADSAQIFSYGQTYKNWIDIGSGAGFPGLVIAILLSGTEGARVDMIESNQKKVAFLRAVIRETGAPARVHAGRIEKVLANWNEPVDVVSARALASLDQLCDFAAPLWPRGTRGLFHKGVQVDREIEEASQNWMLDLVKHQSVVDEQGCILHVHACERR